MSERTRILLRTSEPVTLERRRMDPDADVVNGRPVVATFLDGRVLARCLDENLFGSCLFSGHLVYQGTVSSLGVEAHLFMESADEVAESTTMYLGMVVRLARDLKHPTNPEAEALDHFIAIMSGTKPVVDRILETL